MNDPDYLASKTTALAGPGNDRPVEGFSVQGEGLRGVCKGVR
jgi:hypothetical protein